MNGEREHDSSGALVIHGLFMLGVYIAVTRSADYLSHAVIGQVFSVQHPHAFGISNILGDIFAVLMGLFVIRITGGTRAEHGLTIRQERSYIPHALILGTAAAVILTVQYFIPALLGGYREHLAVMDGFSEHSMMVPGIWERGFIAGLDGFVEAFLLFGVVQAYLMRKSMAQVRLGPRDIPAAGIAVCVIALCMWFPWILKPGSGWSGVPFVTMAIVPLLFQAVVILASSYWFGRSKSIVAPMLAFGMFYGLSPVIWGFPYQALS